MFSKTPHLILSGLAAMLLASCGGGGGDSNNPPANVAPTAIAGPAQTVTSGATITLNGTASSDPDGTIASYAWTQTLGTAVTLSSSSVAQPTFVAPTVATSTQLRFSLVVTDNAGASSPASLVTITVNPAGTNVTVTGTVRFERVPLTAAGTPGLKFASQVYQPARGITVQAVNAAQIILATATTDGSGNYSLEVPGNTSITIRAVARMLRDGSQPLPRWDVRVQNGTVPTAYSYSSAAFNSNVGTQNLDIPSGIDTNGNGPAAPSRPSGPFAVLDTLYTAIHAVVGVEPAANFPAFYVDWGNQNAGTFFSTQNGQHIALMGNLTEDTDEFDQHVVAHEFGHYIEHNFSRSDSVGGPHGLGDRLDMRVAFGEGFGYGFAAIVLNDPVALDSFYNNGSHVAGGFNVESNPPIGVGDGPGCWCSEVTVWSFLWDLVDPATGGDNDGIAIGFGPIWDVMVGPQRTTPAMTSIFTFATALKEARPAEAAAIDARLALNNMVAASMTAFALTETYEPFTNSVLPMYTTVVTGIPVTVRNTDDGGRYNRAGNRRFLRFSPLSTRVYNLTLTTSNTSVGTLLTADPDMEVWQNGVRVAAFTSAPDAEPPQTETGQLQMTSGQEYIIDIYDCANGCPPEPPQGVSGDYDLTFRID